MLKRFMLFVVLGMLLTTFTSYAFTQTNADKQGKEQKPACCQSCCSKCIGCGKCAR